jgi:hypothetical protein
MCLDRDRLVVVTRWSDAPIPWPWARRAEGRGVPGTLVEEELARAVRCESALAIRHWWGALGRVVWCWWQALGVGCYNEGSSRLQRLNSLKGADALRGKPLPPAAVEERRRRTVEMDLVQYIRPCPRPGGSRPWTDDELALLGTLPDEELARRTGRTVEAVRIKRGRTEAAKGRN